MAGPQTAIFINTAIAQRLAYIRTISASIVANPDFYTGEELSKLIDNMFEVSDEAIALIKESLSRSHDNPNTAHEERLNIQNGFAWAELSVALENASADKQLAAEAKLKVCACVNPRLRESLQRELSVYRNHGLFEQIKHANQIERLKRLLG